jgi:Spy/CpxP family protein refolding chaperone
MTRVTIFLLALALALLSAPALAGGLEVGKAGGGFTLKHGDETVTLSGVLEHSDTKAVVVCIASYTCPYSLRADRELKPMLPDWAGRGVRFVAIYPNKHENDEGLSTYAGKQEFKHLMLRDADGAVARSFGAEVTPTFFLFDKTGFLQYRGNLASLGAAMDAVLEGSAVAKSMSPAKGCTVKWPEAETAGRNEGPEGEVPPREVPREGPRDPKPPALSQPAQKWLKKLIKGLRSEDPMVVRSASAAILALGPAAMPQLKAALEIAEEPARRHLAQIVDRLAAGGRPGMGPGRQPGGRQPGGRARGSFLTRHREMIERTIDLTDEQKQQVADLYDRLKVRERELQEAAEGGDRSSMREGYRQLMADSQSGLAEILTEEQLSTLEESRGGFRGGPGGGRRGPGGGGRERERDR